MIKGYEIKRINNSDVLYVYLDFNSEFASLNNTKSNKKLKSVIKKYLCDNKIDFKGITVAIIVGGVLMGTILLNEDKNDFKYHSVSNNIVSIIDNAEINNFMDKEEVSNVENNLISENTKKDNININEEKTEEIIKEQINNSKINDVIKENVINNDNVKKENVNNNDNKKKENVINNKDENKEEVIYENEESNLLQVMLYRSNGAILKLDLEEYIIGVLGAEMPASFNIEALKAQAVVARTYTLKAINVGKTLTDSSSTQNYKSNDELKNMWGKSYNVYYDKIKNAVLKTQGMYLKYNGEIIDAVYHSTSNGKTEDSVNVWGNKIPYLKSVDSIYDNLNKSFEVTVFMSYDEISKKLKNVVDSSTNFNILGKNNSGRISEIEVNGVIYSGVAFRNILGLRSSDFKIDKLETGINFITRGYGHGVGMSQYGANGMAKNGFDFKSILFHYYSGVSLTSI